MTPPSKRSSRKGPLRLGVIGLGQIALKAHLPGFAKVPGSRVTALQSSRLKHAKETAARFGVPHIFKDWASLLESDQVDAVSICTPNSTHAPIALKAFREGKHVLVEKPMAVGADEALAMMGAAKKAGRVLMVHHNMRFDPAVRTAAKLLRKGIIGEVLSFKCSLTHRGPRVWSPQSEWFFDPKLSGGGVLMDLGPHVFDSLEFLLQDRAQVTGAAAVPGRRAPVRRGTAPPRTEVHCACVLQFSRGAVGTVNLGWLDTAYQNRSYFFGTKGALSLNLAKGDPITVQYRGEEGKVFPSLESDSFSPSIYEHFIHCVRTGKTPWVSGDQGLRTLELIEQGYRLLKPPKAVSI